MDPNIKNLRMARSRMSTKEVESIDTRPRLTCTGYELQVLFKQGW